MTEHIHTHISNGGRIVIPAKYRKKLGLDEGDIVTLALDDYGLHIMTPEMALRRLQAIADERIPKEERGTIVDEFIAERHKEAENE